MDADHTPCPLQNCYGCLHALARNYAPTPHDDSSPPPYEPGATASVAPSPPPLTLAPALSGTPTLLLEKTTTLHIPHSAPPYCRPFAPLTGANITRRPRQHCLLIRPPIYIPALTGTRKAGLPVQGRYSVARALFQPPIMPGSLVLRPHWPDRNMPVRARVIMPGRAGDLNDCASGLSWHIGPRRVLRYHTVMRGSRKTAGSAGAPILATWRHIRAQGLVNCVLKQLPLC
ncbi:hypothetical protein FRC12_000134 [Ceratobasidium sp. 428]|nr:hypothetical protein FRC12_000134 [Ceratobasidium sp. 428]